MSQNLYEPYPEWFEKYGPNLELFPHGEYLKQQILETIKLHKKQKIEFEIYKCQLCGTEYWRPKTSNLKCFNCNAPSDFNINSIKEWL